jgi:hypothetical protein
MVVDLLVGDTCDLSRLPLITPLPLIERELKLEAPRLRHVIYSNINNA